MKKKIAYFFWTLAIGGAENAAFRLMQSLSNKNWDIWVLYYEEANHIEGEVKHWIRSFAHLKKFPSENSISRITDFLQAHGIPLVHIIWGDFRIAQEIKRRNAAIRVVASTTNALSPIDSKLNLGHLLTSIRVPHENDVCIIQKKDPTLADKIVVIANGLDTTLFQPKNLDPGLLKSIKNQLLINSCHTIGTVGNIRAAKNHGLLIEVLKQTQENIPNTKLIIVGDIQSQSAYAELIRMIQRYGLTDSVIFTGFQADVRYYLSLMDIYVNTSLGTESCPNAVLEAMSMSKPIIATNNVGLSGLVEDSVNGYVFEQGDSQSISHNVLKLLASKCLLKRYGKMSRSIAEQNFALEKMVLSYDNWYNAVLH